MSVLNQHVFVLIWIVSAFFSALAFGHSGSNPIMELEKNVSQSMKLHQELMELESTQSKVDILQSLVRKLGTRIHLLRDAMARDFPHVRENMSRYKMDYIERTDETLIELERTIEHINLLLKKPSVLEETAP